jgi:hypothetical protein
MQATRPHLLRKRSPVRKRSAAAVPPARVLLIAATVLYAAAQPGLLSAQEPTTAQVDSLRRELARVLARLDSLEAVIARAVPAAVEQHDALARLRAAAEAAAAAARDSAQAEPEAETGQFVSRQRSLQALNPEISLNADLFGRLGKDDPGEQNFIPREFELSFQSSLDPFSRAKIFISRHVEGAEIVPFGEHAHGEGEEEGTGGEEEGGEISVEEGYAQWVNLPGGFSLKLGRFFQQFGNLNRWHAHALPFQTRSLPHLAFIGEEALGQTGISVYWLFPIHGFGTYEATFELTRSENGLLFGESRKPSYLGHLNAFWDLTPSTYFELGFSTILGDHEEEEEEFDQRLFGVEGALSWRPAGRSLYREFTMRGGLMIHDRSNTFEEDARDTSLGWWAMGELRFARQWLVGAQVGRVENPEAADETAWLFSPTLTWWQSEWVRLRAEYDILGKPDETQGQLLLQITFAMGPHKHETY